MVKSPRMDRAIVEKSRAIGCNKNEQTILLIGKKISYDIKMTSNCYITGP